MARPYRNPRIEAEMAEDDHIELEKKVTSPVDNEEDEDWKKRYGDLRRHQNERESALKQEVEDLRRQINGIQSGSIKPPKTEAEVAAWLEEYPETAAILDALMEKKIETKTKDLKRQSTEIKKEKALNQLRRVHSDCEEIFNDPKFHEWMKDRSSVERDIIYKSFDVENAAFVLDKYKAANKKTKVVGDDDDHMDAARPIRSRNKPDIVGDDDAQFLFSESQIERESRKDSKWFDKNYDAIMDALRRGKVKLDISGGAR